MGSKFRIEFQDNISDILFWEQIGVVKDTGDKNACCLGMVSKYNNVESTLIPKCINQE